MPTLLWRGRPGNRNAVTALRARGITVCTAQPSALLLPCAEVVATASVKERPSPSGTLPWIWWASAAVSAGAAEEATLRGCYDVINSGEDGAADRLVARVSELQSPSPEVPEPPGFVARSAAARQFLGQIAQVARTSMPVLITGETGTGKELAARLIHASSARRQGRFMPVNCSAIPNELMEGELFGYAKGAFSGAVRQYDGQLMAAENGTVFLDEIDDTPMPLQVKLLRVLEDKVVTRLGESESHHVDFRILAATNRDLRQLIQAGAFGGDLYERLAIVSLRLPPLRERLEDLPALVQHMMERFYREEPDAVLRAHVTRATPEALRALAAYRWPGNIRELRNVVFASLVAKHAGEELLLSDLPRWILRVPEGAGALFDPAEIGRRLDAGAINLRREIDQFERAVLVAALNRTQGNARRAAQLLGEVGRGQSKDPGGTVRAMIRRLHVTDDW